MQLLIPVELKLTHVSERAPDVIFTLDRRSVVFLDVPMYHHWEQMS